MFDYLRDPVVARKAQLIVDDIRLILRNFRKLTLRDLKDKNGRTVNLDARFDRFMKQHFRDVEQAGRQWLTESINQHTEKRFKDRIKEFKAPAARLHRQESQRNKAKREAYIAQVKTQAQRLRKEGYAIRVRKNQLKEEFAALGTKVRAIEREVHAAARVSTKNDIRRKGGWKTLRLEYIAKEKQVVMQWRLVNEHQRKVDLLYEDRVSQIVKSLENDLTVFQRRIPSANIVIRMPTLR